MGADEVAYHQATVVGRADDHPGAALDYYGSRGETPLRWAGAGAARLGLTGEVTPEAYEAAFGPGGFRDPASGSRLVVSKRPGFELVVSAHKSVAVLGVIDRAEEMHSILDAETAGTMDWLDGWFQTRGGRRGRDQVRTATGGLTYAVTRHATSRAGDPSPHDHVLVANVVEMLDARRRVQGARQRGVAGHGRGGHDGRPAARRRGGPSSSASTSTRMTGRRGICATGVSSVCPSRCVSCSRSGPMRSPSTSPPPAGTATGPAASPRAPRAA